MAAIHVTNCTCLTCSNSMAIRGHLGNSRVLDAMLESLVKQESTQRAQTSADPEDPDFGLWTPGSEV